MGTGLFKKIGLAKTTLTSLSLTGTVGTVF